MTSVLHTDNTKWYQKIYTEKVVPFWSAGGFWMLPPVLGLFLGALVYWILPELGLTAIPNLFSLKKIILMAVAAFGSLFYFKYVGYLLKRPYWLTLFFIVLWPLIAYSNQWLLEFGLNVHLRPLLILFVCVPGFVLLFQQRERLMILAPHFKVFAFFFAWLTFCYLFYNARVADANLGTGTATSGDLGLLQYMAYLYIFLAIGVTAIASYMVRKNIRPYFDGLNTIILVVSALVSLYTILGYPSFLTSQYIDGFQRAFGIYAHPNAFAHHMGLLLLYQMGLFLHYKAEKHSPIPAWLVNISFVVSLIAFLLGLSKSAIVLCTVCAVLLFVLNSSSSVVKRHLWKVVLAAAVMIPVGFFLFEVVTGRSFFDIIEARMNATESLDWRVEIWDFLWHQVRGFKMIIGHGFTAANGMVFQMTYNASKNAKPLIMVHNGYVALMYDLGVLGWTYFVAVLVLLWQALTRLFSAQYALRYAPMRPLLTTVVVLSVYFLVACGVDETTYMFDTPLTFWVFTTLLLAVSRYSLLPASGSQKRLRKREVFG